MSLLSVSSCLFRPNCLSVIPTPTQRSYLVPGAPFPQSPSLDACRRGQICEWFPPACFFTGSRWLWHNDKSYTWKQTRWTRRGSEEEEEEEREGDLSAAAARVARDVCLFVRDRMRQTEGGKQFFVFAAQWCCCGGCVLESLFVSVHVCVCVCWIRRGAAVFLSWCPVPALLLPPPSVSSFLYSPSPPSMLLPAKQWLDPEKWCQQICANFSVLPPHNPRMKGRVLQKQEQNEDIMMGISGETKQMIKNKKK